MRKVIYNTVVGSKLYGTNRPDSDDDQMGVFLPSLNESFGINPFSRENSEWDLSVKLSSTNKNQMGDFDKKLYRIDKFLKLLSEGQSKQTEMLFAPSHLILEKTPEFDLILKNKDAFLSKKCIVPFIEFAKSQSMKSEIKGNNLRELKSLISFLEDKNEKFLYQISDLSNFQIRTLEDGELALFVCGRNFQLKSKRLDVKNKLIKLESLYGSRSKLALESGYDFKSLSHAYRLVIQSKEIISTGKLTFPLKKEDALFLKKIRAGEYHADYFEELSQSISEVSEMIKTSPLRESPDLEVINNISEELVFNHLLECRKKGKKND